MSLGSCEKCQGHLCVSGAMVCCERCGHQMPDHPALKEEPTGFAVLPKVVEEIPAIEGHDLQSRMNRAEREISELRKQIATLKEELKAFAKGNRKVG